MKNVMITGGKGYIGTNLSAYLKKGFNIKIVDKIDGNYVEEWQEWEGFDYIVHLAAMSGVKDCRYEPEQATVDNISATFHLFRNALKYNIPVVFASSGAAQRPEDNFYAATKRIGEVEAIRLNDAGANIKILRFSNVYGGINYFGYKNSVVSKFFQDTHLTINGDGHQTRDFIHVTDICHAIYLAIKCENVVEIPMGVGTGANTSILNLAQMFNKQYSFNYESDLVGPDESPSEVVTSKKHIGFESSIKLEDQIKKYRQITI